MLLPRSMMLTSERRRAGDLHGGMLRAKSLKHVHELAYHLSQSAPKKLTLARHMQATTQCSVSAAASGLDCLKRLMVVHGYLIMRGRPTLHCVHSKIRLIFTAHRANEQSHSDGI